MLIIPNFNTIGSGAARGGGGAPPFEYTPIANNYSMTFDGTNYIQISKGQSLGITNSISISVWVKFPLNWNGGPNPRRGYIISEDNVGGNLRNFSLRFQGGTSPRSIIFEFWNTDGTLNSLNAPSSSLIDNQWHHIVATYDGTTNADGINVYIDTAKTSATAISTGIRSTSNVGTLIGATRDSSPIYFVQGSLDELAVWNTYLPEETIEKIYNTTNNNPGKVADLTETPEGAPLAWYRFE